LNNLLQNGNAASQTIAIIGAGTMGAGIAQVAATAGHSVKLMDLREGAALAAIAQIDQVFASLVSKERMSAQDRINTLARISAVTHLSDMSDAAMVVEVIVENLAAKQALMRDLEAVVSPQAVLASNTSSISITAIANGLQHPQRLVGMHFFNPVPLMKLVEVVAGAETDADVAQAVFELSQRWGKTPVHAKSTPGFIVNRIARPYYAEALALLQEQAASPAAIDAMARSAGFRMGPCELMDLIGHDINFSVTKSVFEANFGDARYQPSLVQQALIDGGRLGRKVGKGFYDGVPASTTRERPAAAPHAVESLVLVGHTPVAHALEKWLQIRGLNFERDTSASWTGLRCEGVELRVSDGRTATQVAVESGHRELVLIDLPLLSSVSDKLTQLGLAFSATASAQAQTVAINTLAACGWHAVVMADAPGLWAARTVCMLINEGADAVHQGVCNEAAADAAMKLGVNWPAGPFEWLQAVGVEQVVSVLDHLFSATRSERYRVSPWLQQALWLRRADRAR
jgi:3-hydroxybutyryl-CoA dehydrogenase